MTRGAFMIFLESQDIGLVRNANQGYSIVRNKANSKMSGVPKNDPLRDATICRICLTLEIEPPHDAKSALEIVKIAHKNHDIPKG